MSCTCTGRLFPTQNCPDHGWAFPLVVTATTEQCRSRNSNGDQCILIRDHGDKPHYCARISWVGDYETYKQAAAVAEFLDVKIQDQPPPVVNERKPVWQLVIEDMQERDRIGRMRYGTPLQSHNGRKPLIDAYQEILDMAVYIRQAIEENTTDELERLKRENARLQNEHDEMAKVLDSTREELAHIKAFYEIALERERKVNDQLRCGERSPDGWRQCMRPKGHEGSHGEGPPGEP